MLIIPCVALPDFVLVAASAALLALVALVVDTERGFSRDEKGHSPAERKI